MTKSIGMIVAGEVGPTQTRLAVCGLDVGRPIIVAEETVANSDAVGLAPMVQKFLQKYRPPQIRAAAFVVGGPIQKGVALATDLPWAVDAQALASALAMDGVTVLRDVEGIAHALPALGPDELVPLNGDDSAESGNQAVLSIGASPGIAGLYWNGTEHRCFATDGTNADFAPANEEELRLALHLASLVPRVTLDVVVSRAGLARIHEYTRGPTHKAPAGLIEAFEREDAATVIVREATTGTDPACKRALAMFLAICGSAAGNLALTLRATGGVYLAGELVPELRAPLASGAFQAAFRRKDPLQEHLRTIPVHAVLHRKAALLGAATVAARSLRAARGSGWNA